VHLEHVCVLDDGIAIFDCIEFNQRFRYSDVAGEVAFLAMDLDFNGYQGLAERFVGAYLAASGDEELGLLVPFYKCYRAYVRGKVIGFRLDDPAIDATGKEEAASAAGRYFRLANGYAARFQEPTLVLMCGLMGTGKSVLAAALADEVGAEQIRTDVVRKELQRIDPSEHHFEEFGTGIYSPEISRLTYQKALELAAERLRAGASVIIDGSYQRRAERLQAAGMARTLGASFVVIECTCPEDVVRRRLDARLAQAGEPSDGRWELFHEQKAGFEPVDEVAPGRHLLIDCAGPTKDAVADTLRALSALAAET
jgi:predicted kinase